MVSWRLDLMWLNIEKTIERIGENLTASWGEKLKRAFIHYFEETELDSL